MVMIFNPRQTVLITVRGHHEHLGIREEHDDVFPLDWHMPMSYDPPSYAIAVSKKMVAIELLREGGAFCVNFVDVNMKQKAIIVGSHGAHEDKFINASLAKEDCESIDCPKLKDAIGHLECEVYQELDAGDHIVFLGKVRKSHLDRDDKRLFHIDGTEYTTTN